MTVDIGIMYPEMPIGIGPAVPYAEAARRGGHRLWFGHSNVVDSHMTMAALAARGYAIPFGSAVALFPLWHPHGFAVQALSVARLSGHSYVAGFGPGGRAFQTKTLGAPFAKPVAMTAEFAAEMKRIVPAPLLTHPSERSQVDPMFGSVETGFGVLRPAMARSAGREAEWAITWLTPERYLRESILPEMVSAAEGAGRRAPRLASMVHIGVERPGRDPRRLAFRAARAHLQAPHYVSMLRQAGLDVDAGDPEAGAAELVRSHTYLYGQPADIVSTLDRMSQSGVGEVLLNVFGVSQEHGYGAGIEDLEDVLAEVEAARKRRASDTSTENHLTALSDAVPPTSPPSVLEEMNA